MGGPVAGGGGAGRPHLSVAGFRLAGGSGVAAAGAPTAEQSSGNPAPATIDAKQSPPDLP